MLSVVFFLSLLSNSLGSYLAFWRGIGVFETAPVFLMRVVAKPGFH